MSRGLHVSYSTQVVSIIVIWCNSKGGRVQEFDDTRVAHRNMSLQAPFLVSISMTNGLDSLLTQALCYVLHPPIPRSCLWKNLPILLRLHSHQCHDTIHHVLERLLVFLSRIRRSLGALHFLSVVPLNLKGRQNDTRVEAVNVLVGVCGQAF